MVVYYNRQINFRCNEELGRKVDALLKLDPEKYDCESTVMRAAILILYKSEVEQK